VRRISDAIRHGVDTGFRGDRSRSRTAVNSRTTEDPRVAALISEVIAADVAAGHKRGPFVNPPFAPFHVSPLSGVPKGEDGQGIRVIHNLLHPFGGANINDGIAREGYIMQSFNEALAGIRSLGRGCLLTKFDVRSAFKLVPVRPEDRACSVCAGRSNTTTRWCCPSACAPAVTVGRSMQSERPCTFCYRSAWELS
jgi:hypothetical protein